MSWLWITTPDYYRFVCGSRAVSSGSPGFPAANPIVLCLRLFSKLPLEHNLLTSVYFLVFLLGTLLLKKNKPILQNKSKDWKKET